MKMGIFLLIVTLLAGCSTGALKKPEDKLYEKVLLAIKTHEINELSESDFNEISDYFSKGKARWLALYPSLSNEPFSGITYFQEGLDISMAKALSKKASETLKFVNKENIKKICGIPFIEPADEEIKSYYIKTRTALKSLSSESKWKDACLIQLEQSFAYLNNHKT
ncbi:hypothetical protein [Erwinia psidii]|uniref:Uncharacterized protein n=1 Tax=Erwinia psidii TaxID=69224 RepID=A0A3N6RZ00_9GAMM|nr:hypothetical protein [Erwinia psidii]MCX8957792.1 hypothetical protein [Erwinia psidii]MCX8960841.1 hypothetical protein [Erwinia psidii]MCX8964919.1 hypothetical protein [Erwinia psidii]RQM38408.1 hypothetical protein EB241_09255 [Erwinia psidii]